MLEREVSDSKHMQKHRDSISKGATMTFNVEQIIVASTGLGYLVVGVLQWYKGEMSNGMIWTGYAFAQIGLWLNLK